MVRKPGKQDRRALNAVTKLYREVDGLVNRLSRSHADRLTCRIGCISCCLDSITVFEIEADNIRRHYPELLKSGTQHQEGACAFLDAAGTCRIYEHRPYVCRSQGLPLRWIQEIEDGRIVEMRDICPLNEEGSPVESLEAGECWTIGPFEEQLSGIQHDASDGIMKRVALRDLFDIKNN